MMEERLPQRPSGANEPTPLPGDGALDAHALQMLATEHWSLLATRSLSWSESFSRTSLFLTVLTGGVVAIALAAQAMAFGPGFIAFALVLLPVILFIGLATYIRLLEVNVEDVVWVAGMNRLRHAYLESRPDLSPLFVTSRFDDPRGVSLSLGAEALPHTGLHALVTTPGMVAVVDAILAAVIAGIVAMWAGSAAEAALVAGAVAFVATIAVLWYEYRRSWWQAAERFEVLFPSPGG